jgi:hypothetical protein
LSSYLPPQRGGILTALGKPGLKICEMRIDNAVARAAHGTLRKILGSGVLMHGPACQLHAACDGDQSFPCTMPTSYLLIKRKAPCAVVQTNLCVRGAARKAPGGLARQNTDGVLNAWQSPQTAMDAGEPALDNLTHVGQQVPPVGDLDRSGCPGRNATGIFGRTVACDNLDPRALPQPVGQCRSAAVG